MALASGNALAGGDGVAPAEVGGELQPERGALADGLAALRRSRAAWASLGALVLIGALSLLAPVYAHHVAHTDPFVSTVSGTTLVHGAEVPVLKPSGTGLGLTPIGPTWDVGHYFLGADMQGRDVMARLLYGGQTSLLVGFSSALVCCLLGGLLGLLAGYFGGVVDAVISRAFDIIWAFPVLLLAICLSLILGGRGFQIGPVTIGASSLVVLIGIISIVYVPYVGRPVRAQTHAIRSREFIQASIASGSGDFRVLRLDVLPNVVPATLAFVPIMAALNMLIAAALSFLGVGVQPPGASWGTMINDGLSLLYTRPLVTVAPGVMIAVTVVAFNELGDALRDCFDPKQRDRKTL